MKLIVTTLIFGAMAGTLGTTIGCLAGKLMIYFKNRRNYVFDKNQFYSILYEFSSGLMMAVVTFHLLPEAMDTGGVFCGTLGLLAGLLTMGLLGKLLHRKTGHSAGLFLFLGILIHNIPEGMAIGTALLNHTSLAASLLLVITLHDIPEGISAFLAYRAGERKKPSVPFLLLLCGISTALAALVGYFAGNINPFWNAISLGFAAGAVLYILVLELSREANRLSRHEFCDVAYILGLLLGILLK